MYEWISKTVENTSNFMYSYLLIILLLAVGLTMGANMFSLLGPKLSGKAIDAIQPGAGMVDFATVRYFATLMALFYVVSAVMDYALNVLMITISRKITYQMRRDIFERLADMPVGYFDTHATGDIISRISYDTDTINASLSSDLVQIFASVITIVVSLYKMLTIQAQLVLVFLFTVPLSVVITRVITKKTHALFRLRSRKLGELNGFVEEMVSGQKTLKAYNQEDNTLDELDDINGQAVEAYYQSEYQTAMMGPSVNFIHNLSMTLVSVFGTLLHMPGHVMLYAGERDGIPLIFHNIDTYREAGEEHIVRSCIISPFLPKGEGTYLDYLTAAWKPVK